MKRKKYNRLGQILLISCIVMIWMAGVSSAEPREGGVDLFVVVDTSLSMEDEIGEAKEYVRSRIFDSLLKKQDHLTLMCFSADAQVLFEQSLDSPEENLQRAEELLADLNGKRHYTDIGNALDLLSEASGRHTDLDLPQYAIFITDGLHDPPPGTRYPGKGRGVVSHPLLEFRKETVRDGWRIWILGPDLSDKRQRILAQAGDIADRE
jgi:Mg-chelatase subunit ChlD